jgi:hypothetical protein
MPKKIDQNIFEIILEPVISMLKKTGNDIEDDEETYNLSFVPFSMNLLFGIICNIKTRAQLITEIKTSPTADKLNMQKSSSASYSEAFSRYNSNIFRNIFIQLLSSLNLMSIPGIDKLGIFMLVDGSIFPVIKTMTWATYKSTANAIKLHLSLNLNQMIPTEFICTNANYSERKFLTDILTQGITYICDRGYVGFRSFKAICDKGAFFIIRCKAKIRYVVRESFVVDLPYDVIELLHNVKDMRIVFKNDKNRNHNNEKIEYRMVTFTAMGEPYCIVTNRFDLTTYEIIMLYAYRWQIELIFRFIKRTQNCIHLLSHDPNGIEIQFHLYMIAYLLLLSFKQKCVNIEEDQNHEDIANDVSRKNRNESFNYTHRKQGRYYVRGLVSILGEKLHKYWKISIHWLITIKNSLLEPFTKCIIKVIAQG